MGTFDRIKDALSETAQDVKERAMQVRDAVMDTAKETRDKASNLAEQAMAQGEKVREVVAGDLDALQLLKKDHEMVSSIFDQIEALNGEAEDVREGLFAQLKYELSVHALVEEKLFYPLLTRARKAKPGIVDQIQQGMQVVGHERQGGQKAGQQGAQGAQLDKEELEERQDLVNEAFAEHALVKQLLAELTNLQMSAPEWQAKLTVLKENVQHHVEEEENDLFAIAREVIDEEQLMKLGQQLEQEKIALADAGKPDEADEAEALAGVQLDEPEGGRGQRGRSRQSRRGTSGAQRH